MKKFNINKKAFTLTELIVVIAIIGILSVVMIPVLTGCIEDAKISNDTVLIANINKVLKANEILDGRNTTAYDAINDASEAGYGIEKLTPTANKCYFMWDAQYDEFVLVNESYGEIFPHDKDTRPRENLFALVGDHGNATKLTKLGFSIYLRKEYNDPTELVINAGLDVGEETNISSIRYEQNKEIDKAKDKDVIIRTNGGELVVNAPNDTVSHYGSVNSINIKAVAPHSFNLFGNVKGNIVVESGHLSIEKNAMVGTIIVDTKSSGNEVTAKPEVTVKKGATVNTIALNTTETIIKVESGATIDVVVPGNEEVKNLLEKDSSIVDGVTVNIDTVVDTSKSSLFAGGLGTENNPFLVSNEKHFNEIKRLYESKVDEITYNGKIYCFKQINDIEISSFSNVEKMNFTGKYDGDNFSISYDSSIKLQGFTGLFYNVFGDTVLKNINYNLKKNQPISLVCYNDWYADRLSLMFENVTINSNNEVINANGTNFGLFSCFTCFNFEKITYKDCINNAHINNAGTSTGVFLGSGWCFTNKNNEKVVFDNCLNNGNITGSMFVGIFYGNPSYVGLYSETEDNKKIETDYQDNNLVIENCKNKGNTTSLYSEGIANICPNSDKFSNMVRNDGLLLVGGWFDKKEFFYNIKDFKINISTDASVNCLKFGFNIDKIKNSDGSASNTTKYFYSVNIDSELTSTTNFTKYIACTVEYFKTSIQDNISSLEYNNGIAFYAKDKTLYLVFANDTLDSGKSLGENGFTTVTPYLYAYNALDNVIGVKYLK